MSRLGVLLVFLATAGCQPATESTSAVEDNSALPSSRVHHLEQLNQDEIAESEKEDTSLPIKGINLILIQLLKMRLMPL